MSSSSYADKYRTSNASSLVRKIYRACRGSLAEPDLGLNLAVADYINDKQGNSPREAIVTIVNLINSKDSHTAIFALALLDVLVKNCGYPLHLQISRKEFLNELVKRFPERPPTRLSRVQRLILGAIEEWNQTICKTSRYKEDLGFIRDMHRLLSYKGYIFPEVKAEDASVLNPSDNLKSLEEIQKEEQVAQAAKLQELVRRGRPSDLKEANKLMKIMAGFKDDNLVESKAKVAEDLNKLKRKADIFNEMLQASANSGSLDTSDDTLVELYSSLKVSQPKIQKLITEEADDEDAVQELLKINDLVNSLIEKYNLLKSGDIQSASKVKVASAGSGIQQSLNLIDFDDEEEDALSSPQPTGSSTTNNTVDDLLGDLNSLSFSNSNTNFGSGGDISLGLGSPSPQPQSQSQQTQGSNYDIFAQLSTPVASQPITSTTNDNSTTSSSFDLLGSGFQQQPQQNSFTRVTVNQSGFLKFDLSIERESPSSLKVKAFISNVQASAISNFTLLLAVPKALTLHLEPQSGSFIPSFGKDSVTQIFRLENATVGVPPKIKWKINYIVNGSGTEETNTFVFPAI